MGRRHGNFWMNSTVNSSRYALDVYKALGFVTDKAVQQKDSVVFYPMKLSLIQTA